MTILWVANYALDHNSFHHLLPGHCQLLRCVIVRAHQDTLLVIIVCNILETIRDGVGGGVVAGHGARVGHQDRTGLRVGEASLLRLSQELVVLDLAILK